MENALLASNSPIAAWTDHAPRNHFFGSAHTLARFENAFYRPFLSDWQNFESWNDSGALDATRRAQRIYRSLLETYEPPLMDSAVREALNAFVARRESEGGVPPQ